MGKTKILSVLSILILVFGMVGCKAEKESPKLQWERLIRYDLSYYDFTDIFEGSSSQYLRDKAAEKIIETERSLSNKFLLKIIKETTSETVKEEAGKRVLGNEPLNRDLESIMEMVFSLREEVEKILWEKASQEDWRYNKNIYLAYVAAYGKNLTKQAWEILQKDDIDPFCLAIVVIGDGQFSLDAWQQIEEKEDLSRDQHTLSNIIIHSRAFAKMAWQRLIQEDVSGGILRDIMREVPFLAEQAGKMILEMPNYSYYLGEITEYAPSLKKQVKEKIKKLKEEAEQEYKREKEKKKLIEKMKKAKNQN